MMTFLQDAVISVGPVVHVMPVYGNDPPKKWIDEMENEHVQDLKIWVEKQNRSVFWEDKFTELFGGMLFVNNKECEDFVSMTIKNEIEFQLIRAGVESIKIRHKNGRHIWKKIK